MTIRISFSEKTVRVAVEINGAIESAITEMPQRTWVGLTKNEVETLSYQTEGNTWKAVELAEAKLKEKNNV